MATKAERFKAESQRTRHEAPKVRKQKHLIDPAHTDTRNVTKRGDKGPSMALEDSMSGKPSRVSTRASSHHGRCDTEIMRAARAKSLSPKARALRAQVARKK